MKLRQLFENIYEQNGDEEFDGSLKTIGVCFGRFNPPHRGHKEVWKAAASNPIWYVGTNQSTSGPKDPLPYDVKLQAMAAVWPKVAGHVIPEQSLLTLASRIYSEHGANVHLKVYTDEEWLIKALQQYNGVEKEHGMYKFVQIDWVKTQRLASATNLRAAVRAGDRDAFYKDMGIKPSVTIQVGEKEYPVFDVVAHFLNKYPEPVKKAKKAVAEARKANTASARAELGKRDRKADPIEQAKKKKEEDADWERLQQHIVNKKKEQSVAECSGYIPKNKKEAKDPRWSNALTVDIHPGAIEKNLKALKLAEQIQQLETELNEARGKMKAIDKTQKAAMQNASTLPALNQSTGSAYMNYRMGIALAGAPNFPAGGEADNWIGGDPLLSTYTDEEFDMIKKAAKQVGAGTIQNWSGKRSQEVADVNKTSTVAKIKKNKYGV